MLCSRALPSALVLAEPHVPNVESSSEASPQLPGSELIVPPNAAQIIDRAIEAQNRASFNFSFREADDELEGKTKQARLQILLRQRDRREAWIEEDERSMEEMSVMLEETRLAVRDRQTSLRSDGYQAFVFPNQDVYEGHWKNCQMHGKGCLRRTNPNDVYEGQWFLGQRCGAGMYHSSDYRTFYAGAWLDNKRHGKGELAEPEGTFVGEFVNNRIEGYGEYVYHDGHVYKGEWVDGLFEGTGTYLFPSGARYEGQWAGGRENGRGTMTYFNGDVYSGDWKNGLPHGYGTYTGALAIVEGLWQYGSVHGRATCQYKDGSSYVGEWRRSMYHGNGVFSSPEGYYYSGAFFQGKRHGQGVYRSERVQYEGSWVNDLKDGIGTIKVSGCGTYHGEWSQDQPNGKGVYTVSDEHSVVQLDDGLSIRAVDQAAFRGVSVRLQSAEETAASHHSALLVKKNSPSMGINHSTECSSVH